MRTHSCKTCGRLYELCQACGHEYCRNYWQGCPRCAEKLRAAHVCPADVGITANCEPTNYDEIMEALEVWTRPSNAGMDLRATANGARELLAAFRRVMCQAANLASLPASGQEAHAIPPEEMRAKLLAAGQLLRDTVLAADNGHVIPVSHA